ncbi:histone family protein DNA-binding protein [Desulfarculus baarsii DSM 2075]|uniref:Histone family protein DNA-binding protein n=1 Tax=Desulfarculus baarsii (strain ATCC 33931 / DSM 2075 / LMG 7858 / VKM B-1802 / 2st14) TaxID=644282 RepID=E1QM94_DESB2|nr:HU family DNA-binding protein [Desulfarculus baarsii]ADK86137.1 histone family protein DNA-binding protein [Desulfarculus baarsii DSM 2075]
MAGKPMTKAEMIDKIASKADISKRAAKDALEAFVEICRDEVMAGGTIRVAGLGTFSLKESAPRQGVNPATRKPIEITAKKRMAFKMSAQVRDMLN